MATECPICLEIFNKSIRKEIKCGFCDYCACKTCIRTYLVGTPLDPHCMNCKKSWDQKFMIHNLNRSYCTNEYKEHRKGQLLEREMSKMPETMQAAENEKVRLGLILANETICQQERELQHHLAAIRLKKYENNHIMGQIYRGEHRQGPTQRFIMPCPDSICRGYLSTAYKCELCELYTCSKCHEIVGHERTNPDHVCDEDMVKSADMIQKDTKPCPKCGARIFKIDGCDQMWPPVFN